MSSYAEQAQDTGKRVRTWVYGLSIAALMMLGAGFWFAALAVGPPRPWLGPAFILAMGLAAIVGASKTSSA